MKATLDNWEKWVLLDALGKEIEETVHKIMEAKANKQQAQEYFHTQTLKKLRDFRAKIYNLK